MSGHNVCDRTAGLLLNLLDHLERAVEPWVVATVAIDQEARSPLTLQILVSLEQIFIVPGNTVGLIEAADGVPACSNWLVHDNI